jgi:pimeloyl-ACP methyl ester carboxylesterase
MSAADTRAREKSNDGEDGRPMNLCKAWTVVSMIGATSCAAPAATKAAAPDAPSVQSKMPPDAKPTIVLVHGAFADASSWGKVIGLLQPEGYTVVAVQNAMTSFEGDVATTERALDEQAGPVVLVAHSYGGMVIGAAAHDRPKVKALVFVAAFGLDEGESVNGAGAKFAAPPLSTAIKQDASGFLSVDPAKFDIFASDVPAGRAQRAGRDAEADPRLHLRRARARSGLEDDPILLSGRRQRRGDQPRLRALHGKANGRDDGGGEVEPSGDDLAPRRRRGHHPSSGRGRLDDHFDRPLT